MPLSFHNKLWHSSNNCGKTPLSHTQIGEGFWTFWAFILASFILCDTAVNECFRSNIGCFFLREYIPPAYRSSCGQNVPRMCQNIQFRDYLEGMRKKSQSLGAQGLQDKKMSGRILACRCNVAAVVTLTACPASWTLGWARASCGTWTSTRRGRWSARRGTGPGCWREAPLRPPPWGRCGWRFQHPCVVCYDSTTKRQTHLLDLVDRNTSHTLWLLCLFTNWFPIYSSSLRSQNFRLRVSWYSFLTVITLLAFRWVFYVYDAATVKSRYRTGYLVSGCRNWWGRLTC